MEPLKFIRGECVEEGFYASQTSDGTIYFVKAANLFDGVIYVSCNGVEVYADSASWEGQIKSFACHGPELFFRTKNYETEMENVWIYKAKLHRQAEIRIEFVRDIEKNEEGEDGMMMVRTDESGQKFARNAWDEKEVEVGEDILWSLLVGVHRGKLIYTRNTNDKTPRVHKMYPNTILIEKPGYGCGEYCDDSSPLVFLCTEWKEMTVVNVDTTEWRNLDMGIAEERDSIYSIVGVHDGKMTVLGDWNGKTWIYTAELPESIREFEQLTPQMETIEFAPDQALGFEGLNARQINDGTIFYVKRECNGADELIYALSNGQTVTTTKSWEGDIDKYDAFGNVLFFLTYSKKIYKATFHQPSEIRVEFVRNVDKLDTHEVGMLFSRTVGGRNVMYRACDHPSKGTPVDLGDEDNNNSDEFEVLSVHRGNLIMQIEVEEKLHARKISPNIVAIETPTHITSIFASEETPLIYFLSDKCEITVLSSITLRHDSFSLSCSGSDAKDVSFWNIVGVRDDKITMWGKRCGVTSLFTALMPKRLRQFERTLTDST